MSNICSVFITIDIHPLNPSIIFIKIVYNIPFSSLSDNKSYEITSNFIRAVRR